MNSEEEATAWEKNAEYFKKIQDSIFQDPRSPSSSTRTAEDVPHDQINEFQNVYQLYEPETGDIEIEIIFVHGLQRTPSIYPHVTTWLARSKPVLWPSTWLGERKFPRARILSVSYETLDLHHEAENLATTLIRNAKVGRRWGCPVVMVGHCLGGLLIKKLCVLLSNSSRYDQYERNFLGNVRGVFFYATPHLGFRTELEILSLSRLNYDFERLRDQMNWRTGAMIGSDSIESSRHVMMVPEASARHGMDVFYTVAHADHFDICRPVSREDSSFKILDDFINERMKEVGKKPFAPPKHASESLQIRLKEVLRRLQQVKRLAIVGMGGIGKSSLAKVVFNVMCPYFEYTCFVESVKNELKKISSSRRVEELLMENLCRRGKKMGPLESKGFLSIVQGKQLLLVLGDVDSNEQMDVICKPYFLGNQSRVIVTSRNKEIFPEPEFSLYDVQLLNEMEAYDLFDDVVTTFLEKYFSRFLVSRLTFTKKDTELAMVKKVVNECTGLPLTIEVIGSYLGSEIMIWASGISNYDYVRRGKSNKVWEGALERLSHAESSNGSAHDKLWGKLRVSIDALTPMDQALFLDCACFFGGRDLSLIKATGLISRWKNLLDRCLVTEICVPYREGLFLGQKVVGMHEQLRDMGRSLVADSGTRIWQSREQALQLLTNNDQDHRRNVIEGLNNHMNDIEQDTKLKVNKVEVCSSTLANMSKLKFLHLEMVDLRGYGPAFPPNLAHMELMHSVRSVPHVFSIYDYLGYPQRSWLLHDSDLVNLENLAVLHISNPSIGVELPEKFGKLRNLKALVLQTPELTSLPDSFCKLSSLETLFIDSRKLKLLPDLFGDLKSLQRLVLYQCDSLTMLPNSFGQLESLRELVLFGPNLGTLPASLVDLPMSTKILVDNIQSVQLENSGWCGAAKSNAQNWRVSPNISIRLDEFLRMKKVQNV